MSITHAWDTYTSIHIEHTHAQNAVALELVV